MTIFAFLFSISAVVPAQGTTVTATIKKPDGTPVNGTIEFVLSQQAKTLAPPATFAPVKTTCAVTNGALAAGCTVQGNDTLDPPGTFYRVRVLDLNNLVVVPEVNYTLSGATVDLSSLPVTATATLVPPTGSVTGNLNVTGNLTVGGSATYGADPQVFSHLRFSGLTADPGSATSGSTWYRSDLDSQRFRSGKLELWDGTQFVDLRAQATNTLQTGAALTTTNIGGIRTKRVNFTRWVDPDLWTESTVTAKIDAAISDCAGAPCLVALPSNLGAGEPSSVPANVSLLDLRTAGQLRLGGAFLPRTTGDDLGSSAARWDAFLQDAEARKLNNIRYALGFSASDGGAKIQACINDLPSTGGTCDARGLEGAQTVSATVSIPTNVEVLLGAASFSGSVDPLFKLNGPGAGLVGLGTQNVTNASAPTIITQSGSGTAIGTASTAHGIRLEGYHIKIPNPVAASVGIDLLETFRCVVKNVLVENTHATTIAGTGIQIRSAGVASAIYNQLENVHVRKFTTQFSITGSGTKTANSNICTNCVLASASAAGTTGASVGTLANDNTFIGGDISLNTTGLVVNTSRGPTLIGTNIEGNTTGIDIQSGASSGLYLYGVALNANITDINNPLSRPVVALGVIDTDHALGATPMIRTNVNGSIGLGSANPVDTSGAGGSINLPTGQAIYRAGTLALLFSASDVSVRGVHNLSPQTTGQDLGSISARWDIFGETFQWYSGTAFQGILSHANTANRTYSFPDANLTVTGTALAQTLSSKTLDNTNSFSGYTDWTEIAAPAAPAAGKVRVYAKTAVGELCSKSSGGIENCMSTGGGAGADVKVAAFEAGTQIGTVGRRLDFTAPDDFAITEDTVNDQFDISINRNSANGIAGLDASAKVAAAQIQEVIGVADLATYSGTSGSGSTALLATITAPGTTHYLGWDGANWINRQVAFSEISSTVTDAQLASNYSGIGSCTNQFPRTLNDNAAPTCADVAPADFAAQLANLVFAGPASGAAADPTFRALVDADIPSTMARDSEITLPNLGGGSSPANNYDFSGATGLRIKTSTGVPLSADCDAAPEVGRVFARTDANATNATFYVCSQTAATPTFAWELAQGGGGGGDNISVNGAAAADADFDDASPAAPTTGINVGGILAKWQKDAATPNNLSAYVVGFQPRLHTRRSGWLHSGSNDGSVQGLGDFPAGSTGVARREPDASDGPGMTATSATTAGSFAGFQGQTNYRVGRNNLFQGTAGLVDTADVRFWFGFSNQGAGTMTDADNPAGNYVAFRFSTSAADTTWKCVSKDGTTQLVTDSTIGLPATTRNFLIVEDGTSWKFFIDGSQVCAGHTTNFPAAGTNLRVVAGLDTLAAAAKAWKYFGAYMESDK